MGKEKKYNRQAYADMLTGNLESAFDIAKVSLMIDELNNHESKSSLPFALLGVTPEQCKTAEILANHIKTKQIEEALEKQKIAEKEYNNEIKKISAKFRTHGESKKFFKRIPKYPANRIDIDYQTVVMLGNLWKADLTDFFNYNIKIIIPTDIIFANTIALDDVLIDYDILIDETTRISSARFVMHRDFKENIIDQTNRIVSVCDIIVNISYDDGNKSYDFSIGTELAVDRDSPKCLFFKGKYARNKEIPGGMIHASLMVQILIYYTAIWYGIMLAYLHPLTMTALVDVGSHVKDEYSHSKYVPSNSEKPALKNVRYIKLDSKTLEKVLYGKTTSNDGKRKYQRHTQLWPVRGYMRANGTWVGPSWRGPLSKARRLADNAMRNRKIVGVSYDDYDEENNK